MRWVCEFFMPGFRGRDLRSPVSPRFELRMVGAVLVAAVLIVGVTPRGIWACACGCSVFDVGTPSLIPKGSGGTVWFEYDFMNQYINWHGSQPASAGANTDKQIKTHFLTVGAQYMFNRSWGVMVTVPYWDRTFRTAGNPNDPAQINQYNHANFGDVRIWGMYTGLSEDMSLGLLAGFKLPTGDHTYEDFDRDTSIGTGSTDLLLGAYKVGTFPTHLGNVSLTFRGRPFQWYAQGQETTFRPRNSTTRWARSTILARSGHSKSSRHFSPCTPRFARTTWARNRIVPTAGTTVFCSLRAARSGWEF
jgi:hypothetical protein